MKYKAPTTLLQFTVSLAEAAVEKFSGRALGKPYVLS
jgi:hypothetical protein